MKETIETGHKPMHARIYRECALVSYTITLGGPGSIAFLIPTDSEAVTVFDAITHEHVSFCIREDHGKVTSSLDLMEAKTARMVRVDFWTAKVKWAPRVIAQYDDKKRELKDLRVWAKIYVESGLSDCFIDGSATLHPYCHTRPMSFLGRIGKTHEEMEADQAVEEIATAHGSPSLRRHIVKKDESHYTLRLRHDGDHENGTAYSIASGFSLRPPGKTGENTQVIAVTLPITIPCQSVYMMQLGDRPGHAQRVEASHTELRFTPPVGVHLPSAPDFVWMIQRVSSGGGLERICQTVGLLRGAQFCVPLTVAKIPRGIEFYGSVLGHIKVPKRRGMLSAFRMGLYIKSIDTERYDASSPDIPILRIPSYGLGSPGLAMKCEPRLGDITEDKLGWECVLEWPSKPIMEKGYPWLTFTLDRLVDHEEGMEDSLPPTIPRAINNPSGARRRTQRDLEEERPGGARSPSASPPSSPRATEHRV